MNLLSHRQYIVAITIFPVVFVLLLFAIGLKGLFADRLFGYQALYAYQLEKIQRNSHAETVFVGDSSLGNSLNTELFSRLSGSESINLALTGLYGYAGSYNMIKRSAGPFTRNIVVMQALDMMTRRESYSGYLMTLRSREDLTELNPTETGRLIGSFYSLVTSPANLFRIVKSNVGMTVSSIRIQNDYVKQGPPLDPRSPSGYSAVVVNEEKINFFRKIVAYCQQKNINLIYVHGPIYSVIGRRSEAYIRRVNELLSVTGSASGDGANVVADVVLIERQHIGDSYDHVHPRYKNLYTAKIYESLRPYLH